VGFEVRSTIKGHSIERSVLKRQISECSQDAIRRTGIRVEARERSKINNPNVTDVEWKLSENRNIYFSFK